MIQIDDENIKSLPLVTNRISVTWDREAFFSKYAIVSYYSKNKVHNLAYEHLADTPCLSVTGIRARWKDKFLPVKFFVLVNKGEENDLLQTLRTYSDVTSKIDCLEDYDDKLVQRIIASLAINALGKRKSKTCMYNDGALLICDDHNFGVKKSRQELVCLRIEVNEYLVLTAKTNSFSHPKNPNDLKYHNNCVFKVSKDIDGYLWAGQTVKPVVIKNDSRIDKLDEYYIQRKRFSSSKKNTVPYWPYDSEEYNHGRLFAIAQVMESVNELFDSMVQIDFMEFSTLHDDACETGDNMLELVKNELSGSALFLDDPFKTDGSKELLKSFVAEVKNIMGDTIAIHKKEQAGDMILKLCDEEGKDEHYEQSAQRKARSGSVLQHYTYDEEEKSHVVSEAKARRILIEFLVKKGIVSNTMPDSLTSLVQGWTFTRYKQHDGSVHGATITVNASGTLLFHDYGFSSLYEEDYETFCREQLHFNDFDLLKGSRDYMTLEKEGNVYMIIDTDEIPILDTQLIDEGYGKVVNEGVTVSMFKRKNEAHKYLRGYMGFHLWQTEGLRGEPNASYSYISGTNSARMKIMQNKKSPSGTKPGTKMDRMPRARRIFVLHAENPSMVESHIMEIAGMLKLGFGRWDEMMTYPFPFKYLQEHLDDLCESMFSCHWSEFPPYKAKR